MAYNNRQHRGNRPQYPYTEKPNPRREPSPRDLASELFADGDYLVQETGGIRNAEEEPYSDLVSSRGWNDTVNKIILPLIRKIKNELLKDIRLDEGHRIGDIRTIALLGVILEEVYKRSGEKMPDWIRSEIV